MLVSESRNDPVHEHWLTQTIYHCTKIKHHPRPDYEGLLLTLAEDDASKPLFDSIEDKIE